MRSHGGADRWDQEKGKSKRIRWPLRTNYDWNEHLEGLIKYRFNVRLEDVNQVLRLS